MRVSDAPVLLYTSYSEKISIGVTPNLSMHSALEDTLIIIMIIIYIYIDLVCEDRLLFAERHVCEGR